jgi:flagellar capping protein FliD
LKASIELSDNVGVYRKLDKYPQSKDDALEALDFIVNVLKEHEKDLDKLINELATVTEQIGDTGELSGKVEKVEAKLDTLLKEVTNLVGKLSGISKEALPAAVSKEQPNEVAADTVQIGPSVILHCKQWEDFQNLAVKAQTLSFSYNEEEKIFQANALKGNKFITYNGAIPKLSSILKMWLSKQFDVPEGSILEGVLAVG